MEKQEQYHPEGGTGFSTGGSFKALTICQVQTKKKLYMVKHIIYKLYIKNGHHYGKSSTS